MTFREKVILIVSHIPRGKTLTYKEVARRAGRLRAYRAAGNILARYDTKKHKIPCHRVVRSDGTVGGYRSGTRKKNTLLRKEKRSP